MDAFLLTTMAAADQIYSQASQRLPHEVRERVWSCKHAGEHEQACGIACKFRDIHYLDTFDRKKFHEWWVQAVEQVQTDQEAYTMFTYGIIGKTPPDLRNKQNVPPPPPPQKDSKFTKWGVPRPPSPPGQKSGGAAASTDEHWNSNDGQGNDDNSWSAPRPRPSRRRSASSKRHKQLLPCLVPKWRMCIWTIVQKCIFAHNPPWTTTARSSRSRRRNGGSRQYG